MKNTKETLVFGFALFAGFFGAGNLILPPFLGFNAGPDWWLVSLGFLATATVIPLLAIAAHARLQGTMFDFGKKVSSLFSAVFCFILLAIAITLPCPRTAAVTHEIAIAPFFGSKSVYTSIVYFSLVFLFVINRTKVLDIIGKFLTPIILTILFAIILIALTSPVIQMNNASINTPIINGLLEGYQTYDAIAGVIMGGVVLMSLNKVLPNLNTSEKRTIIWHSGIIAMFGLFIVYIGLVFVGAKYNMQFHKDISRTDLLLGVANITLGKYGATALGVLVALACFTTAVAIIISVADFFKVYFSKSKNTYTLTAIVCCVLGIFIGVMDVKYIIDVALPILMLVYPICIVLILLNILPEKWNSQLVFRWVVLVTLLFSIPDCLGFIINADWITEIQHIIPFGTKNLGWILPAILSFTSVNLYERLS